MMAINAGASGAPDLHTSARYERLSGAVERVTFHSDETEFCVLRVKARGQRDLVTVTGHAAAIGAGEYVEAAGVWLNDRNHGLQFKAQRIEATVPTTLEGLEKYLGSGMIKGIGPVYAKKLVETFGHDVFEVIEREPTRLREVTGIGPVREAKIIRGCASVERLAISPPSLISRPKVKHRRDDEPARADGQGRAGRPHLASRDGR